MKLDDAIRTISKAKSKDSDFGSEIGDTFDLIELCYSALLYGEIESIELLDRVLENAVKVNKLS